MTWPRLAPIARSSAFSCWRCAAEMLNTLKMMKLPTKIAIRAKIDRNSVRKLRPFSISLLFSSVICWPVSTSTFWLPAWVSVCSIRSASSCCDTDPSPPAVIASTTPVLPSTNDCAVGRSNSAHDAPPVVSLPAKRAVPTTVNCCVPTWVVTLSWSPTFTSPFFADPLSMTISVSPVGRRPSAMLHGVVGESLSAAPNVGGPSPPISLPSAVLIWAKPCTSPVAETTPGTDCTVAISESGIWSRVVLKSASTLFVERTNASVLAYALAKIVSNVPRIVSLNTNTPDRKVVPAMIASAVRVSRPFLASTFFSESRNMLIPRSASCGRGRARPSVRASRRRSARRRGR